MSAASYDRIGQGYSYTRRAEPRLGAAIWRALGSAQTVLNVGAGAGSYEPTDREVVAVEPSEVMIAQRPVGAAPVLQASAEDLPFDDRRFHAAMAVFSDHHWSDRRRGLEEMKRVASDLVVLVNADPAEAGLFWLTTEYLPGFLELIPPRFREADTWERELREVFGRVTLVPFAIPHDCADGFYGAFWRRPAAYLDPAVRAAISVFSHIPAAEVADGMASLRADLAAREWQRRHRDLLGMSELHLGYYVAVAGLR